MNEEQLDELIQKLIARYDLDDDLFERFMSEDHDTIKSFTLRWMLKVPNGFWFAWALLSIEERAIIASMAEHAMYY